MTACIQIYGVPSVADLDEVIGQCLHGVRRHARLHALGVVRDKDSLCGLDNDYAFSTLFARYVSHDSPCIPSPTSPQRLPFDTTPQQHPTLHTSESQPTHLLSIHTPIIRLQHHEPLPRNVQPLALHLLHPLLVAGVLVRRDHGLHFRRRDVEGRGGGPDAVAGGGEDGGAVDGASADQGGVDVGCGEDVR